jgi:uncharacterized protein YjbI with pentapeptide repeats
MLQSTDTAKDFRAPCVKRAMEWNADRDVVALCNELSRHHTSLAVTRVADDRLGILIATARAQAVTLALKRRANFLNQPDVTAFVAAHLAAHETAATTEATASPSTDTTCYSRITRWSRVGRDRRDAESVEPDLFELDCKNMGLGGLTFTTLSVVQSRLLSCDLGGATFDGATFEDSDLSQSDFVGTSWRGARLVRCTLLSASLVDAALDGASVIDCTLRGSDLGVSRRDDLTAPRVTFLRCDLRDSRWNRRVVARMTFDQCRLSNARHFDSRRDVDWTPLVKRALRREP